MGLRHSELYSPLGNVLFLGCGKYYSKYIRQSVVRKSTFEALRSQRRKEASNSIVVKIYARRQVEQLYFYLKQKNIGLQNMFYYNDQVCHTAISHCLTPINGGF